MFSGGIAFGSPTPTDGGEERKGWETKGIGEDETMEGGKRRGERKGETINLTLTRPSSDVL
jgi:hypothetical protein